MRINSRILLFLILIFAWTYPTLAQPAGGTVRGVLTDDSGAVIPSAPVSISGGGTSKTAITQSDGTYSFPGLAAGQYTLSVSFPGFTSFSKAVTVNPGATVQMPVQLIVSSREAGSHGAGRSRPHRQRRTGQQRHRPGDQGHRSGGAAGRSGRSGRCAAGPGRAGRRPQRRPDLHRRIQRRPTAAQGIDPRDSHQPESRFRRNTTGWASAASRFSPSRAPTSCAAPSRSPMATPCSTRAIRSPTTSRTTRSACGRQHRRLDQ